MTIWGLAWRVGWTPLLASLAIGDYASSQLSGYWTVVVCWFCFTSTVDVVLDFARDRAALTASQP